MKKLSKKEHIYLKALELMWLFPKEVMNNVLWANTEVDEYGNISHAQPEVIGIANEYLEFMDAFEYDDPKEAWEDWAFRNNIEHESNPY